MSTPIDLKEIERKAFRSTYQDGLWDMHYGLIIISMAIFVYRPAEGYSPINIVMAVLMFSLSYTLFTIGKKMITLPRMGMVTFGPIRKKKGKTLAAILAVFILLQVILLGFTATGWLTQTLNKIQPEGTSELWMVALIGSLIVGTSMIVIVHFSDFTRGYYIAILMSLAVFLMIYLNQPIYPVIIGLVILLPGLVLFFRFLKQYPLEKQESSDG
ncbi:hypothetical protein ACFLTX_01505 [Chloroflexota bacterium]